MVKVGNLLATWKTLIIALEEADFSELANDLQKLIDY